MLYVIVKVLCRYIIGITSYLELSLHSLHEKHFFLSPLLLKALESQLSEGIQKYPIGSYNYYLGEKVFVTNIIDQGDTLATI